MSHRHRHNRPPILGADGQPFRHGVNPANGLILAGVSAARTQAPAQPQPLPPSGLPCISPDVFKRFMTGQLHAGEMSLQASEARIAAENPAIMCLFQAFQNKLDGLEAANPGIGFTSETVMGAIQNVAFAVYDMLAVQLAENIQEIMDKVSGENPATRTANPTATHIGANGHALRDPQGQRRQVQGDEQEHGQDLLEKGPDEGNGPEATGGDGDPRRG